KNVRRVRRGYELQILLVLPATLRDKPLEELRQRLRWAHELIRESSRRVDRRAAVSPCVLIERSDLLRRASAFEHLRSISAVAGEDLLTTGTTDSDHRAHPRTPCAII